MLAKAYIKLFEIYNPFQLYRFNIGTLGEKAICIMNCDLINLSETFKKYFLGTEKVNDSNNLGGGNFASRTFYDLTAPNLEGLVEFLSDN